MQKAPFLSFSTTAQIETRRSSLRLGEMAVEAGFARRDLIVLIGRFHAPMKGTTTSSILLTSFSRPFVPFAPFAPFAPESDVEEDAGGFRSSRERGSVVSIQILIVLSYTQHKMSETISSALLNLCESVEEKGE